MTINTTRWHSNKYKKLYQLKQMQDQHGQLIGWSYDSSTSQHITSQLTGSMRVNEDQISYQRCIYTANYVHTEHNQHHQWGSGRLHIVTAPVRSQDAPWSLKVKSCVATMWNVYMYVHVDMDMDVCGCVSVCVCVCSKCLRCYHRKSKEKIDIVNWQHFFCFCFEWKSVWYGDISWACMHTYSDKHTQRHSYSHTCGIMLIFAPAERRTLRGLIMFLSTAQKMGGAPYLFGASLFPPNCRRTFKASTPAISAARWMGVAPCWCTEGLFEKEKEIMKERQEKIKVIKKPLTAKMREKGSKNKNVMVRKAICYELILELANKH